MSSQQTLPQSRRANDGGRVVLIMLIVGSVVAIACAFGPVWFARVGVAVAIATAAVVWLNALKAVAELRREHTAAVKTLTLRAAEEMRAERARERATLDTVNKRMDELTGTIGHLRTDLDDTAKELDEAYATLVVRDTEIKRQQDRALQAEKQVEARRVELAERVAELEKHQKEAAELRASIQRYETELAAMRQPLDLEDAGELVGLPRRIDRTVEVAEQEVKQA